MRDILIILITTVMVGIIWFATKNQEITSQKIVTKEILELSTPFNGKIDVEYLSGLKEPAYDN